MQGTIKLVEKVASGDKEYGRITMEDDKKYTCFDGAIYNMLRAGQTIEFEPEIAKSKDGTKTYKRITSCTVLTAAAPETPKTEQKASGPQQVVKETCTVDSRGKDIDFAVAFKFAGECWTTGRMPSQQDLEKIYGLAMQVYLDNQTAKKNI